MLVAEVKPETSEEFDIHQLLPTDEGKDVALLELQSSAESWSGTPRHNSSPRWSSPSLPSLPVIPLKRFEPYRLPVRVVQTKPRPRPALSFLPVRVLKCFKPSSCEDAASTSCGGFSLRFENTFLPQVPVRLVSVPKPNLYGQRFPGEREMSVIGKHDVLRYAIPGGELCYVFVFKRTNQRYDVYSCRECKKSGIPVTVRVVGDDFLSDPCKEPHRCAPIESVKDKFQRVVYMKYRELRKDPGYVNRACRDVWKEILEAFNDQSLGDEEEREKMRLLYEANGFDQKRVTIARNLRRLKKMWADRERQSTSGTSSLKLEVKTEQDEFKPDFFIPTEHCIDSMDLSNHDSEVDPSTSSRSEVGKTVKQESDSR